jgi:hypothetical protein
VKAGRTTLLHHTILEASAAYIHYDRYLEGYISNEFSSMKGHS